MPSPKTGTVTQDIAQVVRELKAGMIEFRADRYGIVHAALEFCKALEEGRNPKPDFLDGVKAQAVLEAVAASGKAGAGKRCQAKTGKETADRSSKEANILDSEAQHGHPLDPQPKAKPVTSSGS